MYSAIRKRVFVLASYFDILFFLEIINFMMLLFAAYGKLISITAGIVLSLLLAVHIIFFYFRNELNRKIQLFIMDLHVGYSIPFLIFFTVYFSDYGIFNYITMALRFVMSCFEIIFIFILSDYRE